MTPTVSGQTQGAAVAAVSVHSAGRRRSLRGSYRVAAVFQKFTMKTYTLLLLFAAFACGLAQGEDNAADELQVETLVSRTLTTV